MKFSAIKRNVKDTYFSTMDFFSENIFGNNWEGEEFIHEFGKHIENDGLPCDEITLDPFGYSDKFSIIFKYNNGRIGWYKFRINKNTKIIETDNCGFTEIITEDTFKNTITDFISNHNKSVFSKQLTECSIHTTQNVTVVVDDYTDYKPNGRQQTLEGTLQDIFGQYTTHNDRLRYCNGDFWRFNDRNISDLYIMFTQMYDGNYFLDNAVKRGVTID